MLPDISDSQPIKDIVHKRTLPELYPSTSSVGAPKPSAGTHASCVTSRVSDYGRAVRQRNEAGEAFSTDSNLLADLVVPLDADSLQRPDIISDEDLEDIPRVPIKTLLNNALQLDRRNKEKRFVSSGDLKIICNHSAVRDELIDRGYDINNAESHATYVCMKPAREIFAVLVLINYVDLLPAFVSAGIVDDNLPFTSKEEQTQLWYRVSRNKRRVEFLNHPQDAEIMREFYNKQWWVHVPFLDWDKVKNQALNFRFDLGTVIPWTEIGVPDKSGGFGVVEKVKIHQDHHSFTHYETFALKTIIKTCDNDDDYKFFQQEIAAFRKMRPGPHLVELCATLEITPGDSFMLLFPWAEGGSLENLMDKSRKKLLRDYNLTETEFVEWIAKQCRGLVDALGTIHNTHIKYRYGSKDGDDVNQDKNYGIHGDIKPANILHFSQETTRCRLGNLKVADFGLITFHTRASRTKMNRATAYAASQTYRSPEHDIGHFMSKKVDIWALGCVFSQFITWAIRDSDGCKDYQQARKNEPSYSGATASKGQWNEDNFFLKHVQKKKGSKRLVPSPVGRRITIGGFLRRGHRVQNSLGRLTTVLESLFLTSEHLEEVPRLKISVIKWIDNLIRQVQHEEGPTFLTDFLRFIRSEMLHPERTSRTDCDAAMKFLNDCFERGSDISWYFSLSHI